MDLWPIRIDREGTLGQVDVALRNDGPGEWYHNRVMYQIAIVDGNAMVYTSSEVQAEFVHEDWEFVEDLGPADQVAIEFDGYWEREPNGRYRFYSTGEPFCFIVNGGELSAKRWVDGTPTSFVLATGVDKIDTVRGWKSVEFPTDDHGLIVTYLKAGIVYYRNYALQDVNPPVHAWETEKEVTDLPTPAVNLSVFRTNDYRVIFACEHNGDIYWAVSERNWSGMGIESHIIDVTGTELLVDFIPIAYIDGYHEDTITLEGTEVAAMLCPAIWPSVDTIYNPEDEEEEPIVDVIYIALTLDIYGDGTGLESAFTVTDEISTNYNVISTAKGPTNNILTLHTENFEGASGDLTVNYTFDTAPIYSQVEGGCLMELDDFNITFTPTVAPPEGYTAHTITVAGTELDVDFKVITYEDGHTDHSITVAGTEVFVDFIHTDDIVT